jgi:GT2 family glycosyltransferase
MSDTPSCFLSIIIPTRDRACELRQCLAALYRARIPGMECIVVDDGGTQDCASVVQASPLPVSLLRNEKSLGSGAARNVGAARARGDVLLFLDDDVCVASGNLKNVADAFAADSDLGGLIGRYDNEPAAPQFLSRFRNLLHAYTHLTSAGRASTFWTAFGAVRTEIFCRHGGFVKRTAMDDVEFGSRLAAAGVRIELRPELQVKHLKRWTLGSMLRTDLLLRGVPWTLLIWNQRSLPNTLNLRRSSRWSVVLAYLALAFAIPTLLGLLPWWLTALAVASLMLLNLRFYDFLRARSGSWFAVASIGAHWLFLWVAGLSFCIGTAMYFGQRMRCALRDQVAEDEMDGAAMSLRADEPRLETAVSVVQAG